MFVCIITSLPFFFCSQSLHLLCCGVSLFANLFTFSKLLLGDLYVLVGHEYSSLVMGSLRLFKDKDIRGFSNATEMSEGLPCTHILHTSSLASLTFVAQLYQR